MGKRITNYEFTAEDIARERDERGQSWRQVAINLGLANPGQARKAYEVLTGKSHKDSNPIVKRVTNRVGTAKSRTEKTYAPQWHNELTEEEQVELMERCENATLVVSRSPGSVSITQSIETGTVRDMAYEGDTLVLNVYEVQYILNKKTKRREKWVGQLRTIRVADIQEVR